MNQTSITAVVKDLFEKRFFSVADWLSNDLKMPPKFTRYPSYPGMSVAVNGQRVLNFSFIGRPLTGEEGNYAMLSVPKEAVCFAPYLGSKGPMVTIDADELASEAAMADIPEEALLEILVLHEMVHVCMMGNIAQRYQNPTWIVEPQFRYIHEAVALKASEFGTGVLLEVATPQHVAKYLAHIQAVADTRSEGASYKPYFENYRKIVLDDFWSELRSSQPAPGIFEIVEELT